MKFKRKYPNTKFIDFDAERRRQAWHAGGLLDSKASRFPDYVEKIRARTGEEVKSMLSVKKKGKSLRTLTQIIRSSVADLKRRRLARSAEEVPVKKQPRSLVINGELITMGSFFPDDYDEKFRRRHRLFMLRKMARKKLKYLLLTHDMPTSPTQLAWIARNANNGIFSTTLPTIKRRFVQAK
jgi:hypothetical protein